MPTVTYHRSSGSAVTVDVPAGISVMKAALENSIEGIIGECGGQAMCATCHVYVPVDAELPERSDDEDEMLDCTVDERRENSRLSCQIVAGRDFDAIAVDIADHQV